MLAALVVAVRRHIRGLASTIWLDGAVGSLGATSVLAVLLSPVLASATVGSGPLARAVAVAYPLFDLLLVAAVAGIAALGDGRMGSRWALLAAGLLVFAAADVVYGLQVTAGTYVLGTPLASILGTVGCGSRLEVFSVVGSRSGGCGRPTRGWGCRVRGGLRR
jgi:hypothetical protein